MDHQGFVPSPDWDNAENFDDKRAQPRVALLLRSAKLVGARGEFLCIVRDVSESGVKLRLFHPLVDVEDLWLEIATGERFSIAKIWEKEGEAGFRFVDAIDVERFIAEAGPHPKRPLRIELAYPAILSCAGSTFRATICDLSQQGAKIEAPQRLALGQSFRLESDILPEFDATVRWRREPFYGLVFRQRMSMSEFAEHVRQLQLSTSQD
ncbi:PilZ domain-containing protein [Novosphingobium mangrovi (ex Huang et al. 2023)]|uniref:PilZ domain-containing protein n=1 Tax=Novosphingobium mangrovi (ex Huang et al. 2023) TaxID=2976432 RepID=A0ABT2HZG2_9SPHN|nr:PilZ domain-containing protein [Novosphingobium mangrovi (ex Huang et al. 2023)]MCT2397949.1 PilZ domain-containing protein [Novosphingobium mangrovi (ex Huang et al. 2023)]